MRIVICLSLHITGGKNKGRCIFPSCLPALSLSQAWGKGSLNLTRHPGRHKHEPISLHIFTGIDWCYQCLVGPYLACIPSDCPNCLPVKKALSGGALYWHEHSPKREMHRAAGGADVWPGSLWLFIFLPLGRIAAAPSDRHMGTLSRTPLSAPSLSREDLLP